MFYMLTVGLYVQSKTKFGLCYDFRVQLNSKMIKSTVTSAFPDVAVFAARIRNINK